MRNTPTLIALPLLLALTACSGGPVPTSADTPPTAKLPAEVRAAAVRITPSDLLASVTRLSADDLEGRAPGTPGDRMTRAYLAERLADLGYAPAFADRTSWHQPFEILGLHSQMPDTWTFQTPAGTESISFRFRDEYMGASGATTGSSRIPCPRHDGVWERRSFPTSA